MTEESQVSWKKASDMTRSEFEALGNGEQIGFRIINLKEDLKDSNSKYTLTLVTKSYEYIKKICDIVKKYTDHCKSTESEEMQRVQTKKKMH